MPALALWAPEDGLLGALAPIACAVAAGSALVVDLDPSGPRYPGGRSLAELVASDPTADDLRPGRGVAVLRNGGVAPGPAAAVVAALLDAWEHVVLRLPPRPAPASGAVPVVPVRLLLPEPWVTPTEDPAVYQATPTPGRMPGPGVRLPVPGRGTVDALLQGRRPAPNRWIRAWQRVWEVPWTA
ncbi:MAG: hypothetical protein R3290_11100 [Acidimicrobiia bacterium]|nr:hypothetical protein [Acidimicrobiia bacterium]